MISIRHRFPIFQNKVYLNSCSQGALSIDVQEAYQQYLKDWQEKGSPWELWVERLEMVREAFAGLVNAAPDEIAVNTSVSAAVSALASGLDFSGERNKVVVTDFAFPTTAQIWHAQEPRGAKVVHVPPAGHIIPIEHFAKVIDEQTLLVSISHICYRNGSRADVSAIVELAHSKGALVLLDSYQALGTFPIDVKELQVDFLVGGVLKYLLASAGLAYLYVRPELIPTLHPTHSGWFAQENIFAMDIYAHNPSPTARRFESGTPPVPNTYAALAGIKLIQSVGLPNIEVHLHELTKAIKEKARRQGFYLVSPANPHQHGALITLRSNQVNMLVSLLQQDGIITSSRDNNLRISPHLYNNMDDVEKLMKSLTKHRGLLV